MASIDVDVDDIFYGMSRREKQQMADLLYDDGIVPKELKKEAEEINNKWPSCPSEQELSEVLNKIWNNRMFIDNNNLETLKHLSKKGI